MAHYIITFGVRPYEQSHPGRIPYGAHPRKFVWPLCFKTRDIAQLYLDHVKPFQNTGKYHGRCMIPGKTRIISCSIQRINSKGNIGKSKLDVIIMLNLPILESLRNYKGRGNATIQ